MTSSLSACDRGILLEIGWTLTDRAGVADGFRFDFHRGFLFRNDVSILNSLPESLIRRIEKVREAWSLL